MASAARASPCATPRPCAPRSPTRRRSRSSRAGRRRSSDVDRGATARSATWLCSASRPEYQVVQDYAFAARSRAHDVDVEQRMPVAVLGRRGGGQAVRVGGPGRARRCRLARRAVRGGRRDGAQGTRARAVVRRLRAGADLPLRDALRPPADDHDLGEDERRRAEVDGAMARAEEAMRIAHGLRPGRGERLLRRDRRRARRLLEATSRAVLFAVMPAVVAIGIVVGGIVIMNIMLMAVNERTREIGIRKAVGARARDIERQFLAETVALSAMGGIIGVLSGWGFAVPDRRASLPCPRASPCGRCWWRSRSAPASACCSASIRRGARRGSTRSRRCGWSDEPCDLARRDQFSENVGIAIDTLRAGEAALGAHDPRRRDRRGDGDDDGVDRGRACATRSCTRSRSRGRRRST